jgi:hypothetical protein
LWKNNCDRSDKSRLSQKEVAGAESKEEHYLCAMLERERPAASELHEIVIKKDLRNRGDWV